MTNATEVASPLWLLDWIKARTTAPMLARQAVMIASSVTREVWFLARQAFGAGGILRPADPPHPDQSDETCRAPTDKRPESGRDGYRCDGADDHPDDNAEEGTAGGQDAIGHATLLLRRLSSVMV